MGTKAEIPRALPDRTAFSNVQRVYLDSGTTHPISVSAKAAVKAYLDARDLPGSEGTSPDRAAILSKFARLINADIDEVAFVQSTTAAEHMIVDALDLFDSDAHIVTDTLHFFGSFPLYLGLARRGTQVSWVQARDGRIRIEDMARAITPRTRLVSLSLVSTYNGFQHDLEEICALAHAQDALVYADIIQSAGCVPIDVKASGVDFAACASYKWLMADFGLGFVYARRDSQQRLRRRRYGYYGLETFQSHAFAFDPPGDEVADFTMLDGATGRFAGGTFAHSVAVHLDHSFDYLLDVGVDRINAHVQSLTAPLKEELPKLGYPVITPKESTAPFVTCPMADPQSLEPRLAASGVRIGLRDNHFRITPSVFNDMADIEHLLRALRD